MHENEERIMNDYTAAKLANLLGLDPLKLITQANAEREKNEKNAPSGLRWPRRARPLASFWPQPLPEAS